MPAKLSFPEQWRFRNPECYTKNQDTYEVIDNAEFEKMAEANILENEHSRAKLPEGDIPRIKLYKAGNVFVGIDLVTGEFCVESEAVR